jgi:hypothetical protein
MVHVTANFPHLWTSLALRFSSCCPFTGDGKLDAFMEKRRKKNASKDNRYMSYQTDGGGVFLSFCRCPNVRDVHQQPGVGVTHRPKFIAELWLLVGTRYCK